MKIKLLLALSLACFSVAPSAQAVISFTGLFASNLKKSDGTTNIPVGNRYIVVVDSGGNGFGASTNNSIANGTTFSGTFGDADDFIIESSTVVTLTGRAAATIVNNDNWDTLYGGKQFALVWFDTLTSSNTSVSNGDKYGFARDTGWIMPSATGTYDFTTTPSVATDFRQLGGSGFLPGGTPLTVGAVPEPSRLMLLGFGLMGLFFRRRR